MRWLLSAEGRRRLADLAEAKAALVFDFDGTLAPIVADPARAQPRPRTRALLKRLVERFPCAVISGRTRADVAARLRGIALQWIVGNHGADWGWRPPAADQIEDQVRAWRARLEAGLQGISGLMIEDKRYALAVHFRRCREKRRATATLARLCAGLDGVRVRLGHQVVNLVPEGAPHKGIALEEVRRLLGCDTALYIGDDVTDEDVFALDEPGQLLAVRVGASRSSHADYYLEDQMEMDDLLRVLIELRAQRELRA